jgi:hypothetical protein
MKFFSFLSLLLTFNAFGQNYVNQVLILNEGYYNYVDSEVVVPVTIGSYDPSTEIYTTIDTIEGARFGSDIIINDGFYYVAADTMLLKYDLLSNELIETAVVPGIRNIVVHNDNIIVTRGEYQINFSSYLQVYSTNDLSIVAEFDTINGPKWASQNLIVKDDIVYVGINNGFEWGNEKGIIGLLDMTALNYINEIDLGVDATNIDNMMTDGQFIYTVNNKDWSGASITKFNLTDNSHLTTNIASSSTGCGTSSFRDNKLIYQISNTSELYEWDPITFNDNGNVIEGINQGFYDLAYDNINQYLYTSVTDYFSFGKVIIYNNENELIKEFDCGVSPGTMAFDIRNASGISNYINEPNTNNLIFDIKGNKVEDLKSVNSGIYIQNGKKIFISKN